MSRKPEVPGIPWSLLLLLVIVTVLALFPRAQGVTNLDTAWFSHLADYVLRGKDLYNGIIEVNPPMPIWIVLPAAILSDLTDLDTALIFNFGVYLIGLAAIALSYRVVLKSTLDTVQRRALLGVLFVSFFLVSRYFYGQREHLASMLIMPYVLAAGTDTCSTGRSGIVVGSVAGLGIGLKPPILISLFAIEGWRRLRRRSEYEYCRADVISAMVVLALYGAGIVAVEPDYSWVLKEYVLPLYPHFRPRTMVQSLSAPIAQAVYVLLATALMVRSETENAKELISSVSLGAISLLFAGVVQRKDLIYHLVPALLYGVVAVGTAGVVSQGRRDENSRGDGAFRSLKGSAALFVFAVFTATFALQASWLVQTAVTGPPKEFLRLKTVLEDRVHRPTLAGFNFFQISPQTPYSPIQVLIAQSDARWVLEFPSLWPIAALRHKAQSAEDRAPRISGNSAPLRLQPLSRREKELRSQWVRSLRRSQPDVLFVPGGHPDGFSQGFEVLPYFRSDPAFEEFFRQYEYFGKTGGFSVYLRGRH